MRSAATCVPETLGRGLACRHLPGAGRCRRPDLEWHDEFRLSGVVQLEPGRRNSSGAGATATFVNSKGFTSVTNASGTIGGLLFNDSNTPSYTIDLGFQGLTLASTGIVNNSSVLQTITGGGTSGILQMNAGTLFNVNLAMTSSSIIFAGTASAGNASITNISNVNMNNSSTLANATVTKNGGALNFLNTSSGGQASVILNGSGRLQFANYTGAGTTIGSLAGSGTVSRDSTSRTLRPSR